MKQMLRPILPNAKRLKTKIKLVPWYPSIIRGVGELRTVLIGYVSGFELKEIKR